MTNQSKTEKAIFFFLIPAMRATGFRFSKDYRWGTRFYHRAVYAMFNTVSANHAADRSSPKAMIQALTRKAQEHMEFDRVQAALLCMDQIDVLQAQVQ